MNLCFTSNLAYISIKTIIMWIESIHINWASKYLVKNSMKILIWRSTENIKHLHNTVLKVIT